MSTLYSLKRGITISTTPLALPSTDGQPMDSVGETRGGVGQPTVTLPLTRPSSWLYHDHQSDKDQSFSHPQQGRIDFNIVNPFLMRGMDFLIHPCRSIDDEENVRIPPKLGRYWEIHPLRLREISWALGMDFPIPPSFWWSMDTMIRKSTYIVPTRLSATIMIWKSTAWINLCEVIRVCSLYGISWSWSSSSP